MKTIMSFIKSNGLQSIFLIIMVGIFFVALNQIGQCTDKNKREKLTEQIKQNEIQAAVDDSRIKPLQSEILKKDSAIKVLKDKLKQSENHVIQHKNDIEKYKSKAEKLLADYEKIKTIPKADKVIEEQNKIISEQDSVIEYLGQEAESYSNMALLFQNKYELETEIVTIKDNALKIKDNQINELIAQNKKTLKRKKLGDTVRNIIIFAETVFLIIKM